MDVTIATGPDSWGVWFPDDDKQISWDRYLDECAEAGYGWTELGPYGYMPTDPAVLKSELDRRGVKVCAAFVMRPLEDAAAWADVEREIRGFGPLLTGLGARHLVLIDDLYTNPFTGEMVAGDKLDAAAWDRLVATVERATKLTRDEFGLQAVFHPHAESHVEYEDQIERLLEATDASLVQLCLDIGHHAYRGGDPVAFMRKHHARIPYLHLKNVDSARQADVAARGMPFATAVAEGVFCEPDQGAVDFAAFRDLLGELDYEGFAVVEQDMYPCAADKPLPIARRTRAYLRQMGLG